MRSKFIRGCRAFSSLALTTVFGSACGPAIQDSKPLPVRPPVLVAAAPIPVQLSSVCIETATDKSTCVPAGKGWHEAQAFAVNAFTNALAREKDPDAVIDHLVFKTATQKYGLTPCVVSLSPDQRT